MRIKLTFCKLALFFSAMFCVAGAWAAEYHMRAAPSKPLDMSAFVDLHDDMSGRLRLSDVADMTRSSPGVFQRTGGTLPPMQSQATRWLHFSIHNDSSVSQPLFLIPASIDADEVEVGIEVEGVWTLARTGSDIPLDAQLGTKDRRGQKFLLPPNAWAQIYIGVRNALPDRVGPILESVERHTLVAGVTKAWDIALISGLLVLAWCAIVIGGITRRLPYILLGLLTAAEALYETAVRGYAQALLWPAAAGWGSRAELVLSSACIVLFFLFLRSLARRDPLLAGGLLAVDMVLPLMGALLAAAWTTDLYTVSVLLTAIGVVLGITLLALLPFLPRRNLPTSRLMGIAAVVLLCHTALRADGLQGLQGYLSPYPELGMNAGSAFLLSSLVATLAMLSTWTNRLPWLMRNVKPKASRPRDRAKLRVQVQMHTAALDRALQEATVKRRQQEQLLGYISHDLRAPLATIANYMRLVRAAATPEQQSHLDVIERSLGHQFQLVDEVLTYARGQTQPLDLAPAAASPTQLLSEVIGHAVAFCAPKRNAFHFLPPASLPVSVMVDAGRLRQVLLNLLDNATKFTEDGRVSLCVTTLRRNDAWIFEFLVADNGPGIPLERQAEIFSAFKQLRHEHGGVGLGLFIAEHIVRTMGGELTLSSTPGDGARFGFRIEVPGVDQTLVSMSPVSVAPSPRFPDTALPLPPLAARAVLARLAHDGEISELRAWLARARADHPECAVFMQQIEKALADIDLSAIERLAAATGDAPSYAPAGTPTMSPVAQGDAPRPPPKDAPAPTAPPGARPRRTL